MYPFNHENAIKIIEQTHTVNEYVEYINANCINQAWIVMPDLEILRLCPTLKYLHISPSYNAKDSFDFSPLYEMKELKFLICDNVYGDKEEYCAILDCSKRKDLEYLSVTYNKGILNLTELINLKSLIVRKYKEKNLNNLFKSKILDTLELTECSLHNLEGIEQSEKMQCLYLNYNRSLKDISALKKIKNTLKALYIQKCPKIEDFQVLEELENLETLVLLGNNKLPDLQFLKNLKKLKTFEFDYEVLDGVLDLCMSVDTVYCNRKYKHYNLSDKQLPKGEYVLGNENIDEWRRLE